jgi:two-component system invasion response regulator UvrY
MKILVVDDHAVVREGVRRLLLAIEGVTIIEAETAHEGMTLFRREVPDIVVLDINLKNSSGIELLRRFRIENAAVRVVIFSMYSDVAYATSARRAGAIGYVSKSAPAAELNAVKRAARGEPYVDSETARELASAALSPEESLKDLTPRETEILRLLGEGKSLSGIAETLGIAYKTVANTCSKLKEKLGLERTGDLIRLAVENRTHKLAPD